MAKKNVLKFTDNFPKLHGQVKGKLVEVVITPKTVLCCDLIKYDTEQSNGDYFPLKNGICLVLYFIGDKGIPFTIIRKGSAKNFDSYKSRIGEKFNIVVEIPEKDIEGVVG